MIHGFKLHFTDVELFRDDPAFKKMVSLCCDSTYSEFFWFPNRGTDEGYWENCWIDDGNEKDAVDINESVDDEYQVAKSVHSAYFIEGTCGLASLGRDVPMEVQNNISHIFD